MTSLQKYKNLKFEGLLTLLYSLENRELIIVLSRLLAKLETREQKVVRLRSEFPPFQNWSSLYDQLQNSK